MNLKERFDKIIMEIEEKAKDPYESKALNIAEKATDSLLDTIIKRVIGVALFIITICATTIFIYYKWHDIADIIKNLF